MPRRVSKSKASKQLSTTANRHNRSATHSQHTATTNSDHHRRRPPNLKYDSTSDLTRQSSERLSLLRARYSAQTQNQYLAAVRRFVRWAGDEFDSVSTTAALDTLLVEWMEHLFRRYSGRGRHVAVHTYAGLVMLRRELRGRLPNTCAALDGWRRRVPSKPHPPLTWPLTCAIAYESARLGWVSEAVGTFIAFDCYLRVSELAGIRCRHVFIASELDDRFKNYVSISLAFTKTGRNQSVRVSNRYVAKLLMIAVRTAVQSRTAATDSSDDRLFQFTANQFRTRFKPACANLGLSSDYVPHSLRHGGATTDYMLGVPVADIKVRGRWRVLQTGEHYLQVGKALMASTRVPRETVALGKSVARDLLRGLASAGEHSAK